MNKIRLLMSARDPGAAANIIPLARNATASDKFEISIYASEPAFSYIKEAGLAVNRFVSSPVRDTDDPGVESLIEEADRVLYEVNPDVILTGLSSLGAGIDEALLLRANIPFTFAIQDFWGDVNSMLGGKASTYFVIDNEASILSRHLHGVDTVVTGMSKYSMLKEADTIDYRHRMRIRLNIDDRQRMIGFFGQPLWNSEWYEKTLRAFAESVTRLKKPLYLFYRPHPKESKVDLKKVTGLFSLSGVACEIAERWNTDEWLAASDLVCTVFSNCGYDQIMLNRLSPEPLSVVVYMLFGEGIIKLYKDCTGMDYLPPVKQNIAFSVENEDELLVTIEQALDPLIRKEIKEKINEIVPNPSESIHKMLEIIIRKSGK